MRLLCTISVLNYYMLECKDVSFALLCDNANLSIKSVPVYEAGKHTIPTHLYTNLKLTV